MKTLVWDIETAPNLGYVWRLFKENISLAQLQDTHRVLSFAYKWRGDKKARFVSEYHDGRAEMIEQAYQLLSEADAVVSWNGPSFDTKHFMREFIVDGYDPPSPFHEIDLLKTAKKKFRFASNKLDHVAHQLLGERKVQHTGFEMWRDILMGSDAEKKKAWALMKRYNLGDVELTDRLYDRLLPWIDAHPHVGMHNGGEDAEDTCRNCGGNYFFNRGYTTLASGSRYRRLLCVGCGRWSRSNKRVTGASTT